MATPQEIRFSFPSGQTIYLNGPQAAIVGSDVRIDGADMFGNVVIDGAGWTPVTVAAATPTTRLVVANLTLRHGQKAGKGGCVSVLNPATTTMLDRVSLIGCKAFVDVATPARGGAVYAAGPLSIADSVFDGNQVRTAGASAETAVRKRVSSGITSGWEGTGPSMTPARRGDKVAYGAWSPTGSLAGAGRQWPRF